MGYRSETKWKEWTQGIESGFRIPFEQQIVAGDQKSNTNPQSPKPKARNTVPYTLTIFAKNHLP
jgi:hypothetical protein